MDGKEKEDLPFNVTTPPPPLSLTAVAERSKASGPSHTGLTGTRHRIHTVKMQNYADPGSRRIRAQNTAFTKFKEFNNTFF
jgi:hypothetical protein